MKLFSNHAISFAALFAAATSLHAQDTLTSAVHPGKIIWEKHCVECHGQNGEGVKGEYSDPLHGDRTVASLSKRIDRTMPEEDPDLLNAEESAQVAEYIYNAFYSEESRAKSAPPLRHSFSRLTVPQFRNSVADLFSNPQSVWSSERGLSARYSSGKDKNKEDFQRKDNQVRFDFGEASPQAEVLPADNFSIKWEGSIIAEETGVYIFVIRTQNGARLSVNNWREPIIDAWVSSGPDVREEKGSIFLLGGRAYPISLEHFKFKEKSSSIELLWKAPNGVLETIPQRNLFPYSVNESLVISTTFPADDSSDGYPRGTSISKAWFEAVTNASIAAAESIT